MAERAINDIARAVGKGAVHYASELCRLSCAPMLIPLFPNFKEVTESFSAFAAVRNHLSWSSQRDPSVTVVAVGDGSTPRTAATFALRTAWQAISIDPNLKGGARTARNIRRLAIDPRKVEETRTIAKRAIVVAVHSHADLRAALRTIEADEVSVVTMPCCVPQVLSRPPDVEYEDYGCLSPQRTVMVWRDARGAA
jgi:hypothetical protein